MEPQALSIAHPSEGKIIEINEDNLKKILLKDEVKDKYISVISITGAFRQGKSFLLNFLLRYLHIRYNKKEDVTEWLRPDDGPLEGFCWRSGSNRHTIGILMWSEIFSTEIAGKEVAVIVVDTQGSFDFSSSVTDCAGVFALSTLISSVQIYNVMRIIGQCDMSHLRCFGGYGRLMANTTDKRPFQKLLFLVRDWPFCEDKEYGCTGGSELLEEVFQSDNNELKAEYDNVKQLFSEVECFLLPYPGRLVDSSPYFTGTLNDIDEKFLKHVQEFIVQILAPENLILKTVNGDDVTAGELCEYIISWGKILQEDSIPKVEIIFETTVRAQHKIQCNRALQCYRKEITDILWGSWDTISKLHNVHSIVKIAAIKQYTNDVNKIASDNFMTIANEYVKKLKNDIDENFENLMMMIEERSS